MIHMLMCQYLCNMFLKSQTLASILLIHLHWGHLDFNQPEPVKCKTVLRFFLKKSCSTNFKTNACFNEFKKKLLPLSNVYSLNKGYYTKSISILCVYHQLVHCSKYLTWPRGFKTFFMFDSVEHDIFPVHTY